MKLHHICHFLILYMLIAACNNKQDAPVLDDMEPAAGAFLNNEFLSHYFNNNLHAQAPAYCFQQIQQTVPKKWWRYAVESLYYRLPEKIDDGSSEKWLSTADSLFQDKNVHAFVQMIRGILLCESGKYDDALICLSESYQLSLLANQPFRANDARRYMARCYLFKGEYPDAAAVLTSVDAFLQDKSDFVHQVRKFETMLQLATVYHTCTDYRNALYWNKKALTYVRQTGDMAGQKVIVKERIAKVFLNLQQPDSALYYLKKARMQRLAFRIKYDSASGHYLFGKTLVALGRCKEALPWLELAESGNLEKNDGLKIGEIKIAMADCMRAMGVSDSAIYYYQQALALTTDPSAKAKVHHQIAALYEQGGQFQQALHHHQMGNRFFSGFFSMEKDRKLGRLAANSTLTQLHGVIKKLKVHRKKQQFLLVFLLGFLLSASGITLFFSRRQRNKRRVLIDEQGQLKEQQWSQQQELDMVTLILSQKEEELSEAQHLLALRDQIIHIQEQKTISTPLGAPLRMLTRKDWLSFQQTFEAQFPAYIYRLKAQFDSITSNEIRLFILIKIGLDNHSIADISGISIESVYRNRARLRKKLGMDSTENLEKFIVSF
jgi:tetratricopeptide (TPR) repeat protein/DNA-binding CsgD family transcriptional regulator